jgi:hypothetical protein
MDRETAYQWLRDCLNRETDNLTITQLNSLSIVDWELIVQLAIKQDLAPLLHYRLKNTFPRLSFPEVLKPTLKETYFASLLRNTLLYSELTQVTQALQQEGISVIMLKGVDLAQNIYNNIALRSMSDIDILVRRTDLKKADEELGKLGYRKLEHQLAYHHLPPFFKEGAPLIEVHWHIERPSNPFTIDIEELWQRAQPTTIAECEVLVLSPEDLLLHLCVHAAFHHLFQIGLRSLYDIAEVIYHNQNNIEWEAVCWRTQQWGANNSVYLALYLAQTLVGAAVPREVLDTLKPDDCDPRIITWAKAQLVHKFEEPVLPPTELIKWWKSKQILEKIYLFRQRVFLPRAKLAKIYSISPDLPPIYFYYIRLKDLLVRHSRTLWQLLRRKKEMVTQVESIDWLSR